MNNQNEVLAQNLIGLIFTFSVLEQGVKNFYTTEILGIEGGIFEMKGWGFWSKEEIASAGVKIVSACDQAERAAVEAVGRKIVEATFSSPMHEIKADRDAVEALRAAGFDRRGGLIVRI